MPEPLIKSSFISCPEMWPQFTQLYTQWVLWEFVVKLGKLRVNWEYIKMNPVGKWLSMFWAICERTLNEWFRHMLSKFWSNLWKNSVGSFTKCLLGKFWSNYERTHRVISKTTWWANWWAFSDHILNLPSDLIEIKVVSIFWKNSQFAHWVNCE